jgi:CRP/FNR family cyclic AMP-dependent transcriptional regulator
MNAMSDELDFSGTKHPTLKAAPQPAPQPQRALYNPALALQFFKGGGKFEEVAGGKLFFAENDKAGGLFSKDRMYLLIEGEIGLMAKGSFIGLIRPGEIFGEMAVLAKAPRSASAMAKTACKALSLDEKQFVAALSKTPEFALMMMSVMVNRLRQAITRQASGATAPGTINERQAVFNKKELAALALEIPPLRADAGKTIMNAGDTGVFMYIVENGRVAISIQSKIVERVGPGGVFGEMALVDNATRAATATAEMDSTLILVKRADFLGLVKMKPEFGASVLRTIAERMQVLRA